MSKKNRAERGSRRAGRSFESNPHPAEDLSQVSPRRQRSRDPLRAKTEKQKQYINVIKGRDLIFCKGPMGTGKTYIAASMAAAALDNRDIESILITRPAVVAGEEYGHLPGEIDEKWEPFFAPVRSILEERLGSGQVEMFLKNGRIKIAPLGFLRGHTFKDCWVLFDEAQNSTPEQMKLFLTRIGENCKVIVDGDPDEQRDIAGRSGFDDAWERLQSHDQIGFIEFGVEDIVRSGLARDILLRYRKDYSVGQAELGRFMSR